MNLVSAGRSGDKVTLIFSDGKREVVKYVRISDTPGPLEPHSVFTIRRAAREAERDFAFYEFGDQWPLHVSRGRFWNAGLLPEEAEIIKRAVILLEKTEA